MDGHLVWALIGLEVGSKAALHLWVLGKVMPDAHPGVDHHLGHIALAGKDQVVASLNVNAGGAGYGLGPIGVGHGHTGGHIKGAVLVRLVAAVHAEDASIVAPAGQLALPALAEETVPQAPQARDGGVHLFAVAGAHGDAGHAECWNLDDCGGARPWGGVGGPPARHAIGQRGGSTIAAVMRRTTGSTSNSAGKATTQDSAQALSHRRGRSSEKPATRTVLIRDTMKVMSSDSSSGMTQAAERAGNLRSPRKVWRDDGGSEEGWFIEIPESRPVKQGAAPTLQQMQARDHNPGRAGVGWHVDGRKNVFAIFSGPRWGAIGMSGCFGCAAWAHAHASSRGIQSPDFAPTLRASALPGGLRRCGACG